MHILPGVQSLWVYLEDLNDRLESRGLSTTELVPFVPPSWL